MSFIHAMQSLLPRPEHRSRPEIERDLEDEFAFHLEMKARALQSEEGLEREAACSQARLRFGDLDRIRKDCQRIALKERIMLQRVNLILMIIVMLVVVGVGAQVMVTQRYNTLALQAITADLARMKFQDLGPTAPSAGVSRMVYIDGDVQRPGVFALPPEGPLTLSRAITAAGGARGRDAVKVIVHGNDGAESVVRYASHHYDLRGKVADDYVLEPNDRVVVIAPPRSPPNDGPSARDIPSGRWVQVDNGVPLTAGATMDLLGEDDVRNLNTWPVGSLDVNSDLSYTLNFTSGPGSNLQIKEASGQMWEGRWEYRNPVLVLNITAAAPEITEPLTLVHESAVAAGGAPVRDARAQAVGDFVVRLFALADPSDPDLDQTIRDFLDDEEKMIDTNYADDPATAGMIRELIAARRKVFEADANALRAADAEARASAVTDFLSQTFASADPDSTSRVNVREVLDHAASQIDTKFADDPEVAARIRAAVVAATWQAQADDGSGAAGGHLTDEQLQNFISRLMVASIPQADPAKLPQRAELDRAESAIAARYGDDPTLLARLNAMIATVRARLDEAEKQAADAAPLLLRANDDEYPELSPFFAVQWKDYTPFVNVNGTWGELVSIDDVPAADLVDFCRRTYADRDRKRFTEDLVQVMAEMGRPPGIAVKLTIKEFATGSVMTIENAAMTEENRRALWEANNRASETEAGYPVWTGQPPDPPKDAGSRGEAAATPTALTRAQIRQDLDTLERAMRERFSYLHLRDVDFQAAMKRLGERFVQPGPDLHEQVMMAQFAPALQQFIARFGDAHAAVGGYRDFSPRRFTPFIIEDAGGQCVAVAADRTRLLDDEHPYLASINGVAIEHLTEIAGSYVVDGSPAVKRRRSIDLLRNLGFIGAAVGMDFSGDITVELTSADGASKRAMSLGPALRESTHVQRPERASGLIDGNVGYIRLAKMTEESARMARWLMPQFKETRGLIIDVRGNGGGSRDALLALLPHVLARDAPPMVLNIAAYRLHEAFEVDHLESRFMYRRDDAHWSDAERAAIDAAMTKFKPAWLPPEALKDHFSEWHYLVLSRADAAKANPDLYHYDKPVIVLLDGGCFSATDIFLGAFKGLPNVTLMGTASSGGSGRKQSIRLPNSGLTVSLSSMISYLPDGAMFDLHGIAPDVEVPAIPTDFVREGGTDTQLEAAIARLTRR